jgi:hypothetical protein
MNSDLLTSYGFMRDAKVLICLFRILEHEARTFGGRIAVLNKPGCDYVDRSVQEMMHFVASR